MPARMKHDRRGRNYKLIDGRKSSFRSLCRPVRSTPKPPVTQLSRDSSVGTPERPSEYRLFLPPAEQTFPLSLTLRGERSSADAEWCARQSISPYE